MVAHDSAGSLKPASNKPLRNPKRATRRLRMLSNTPQDISMNPKLLNNPKVSPFYI